MLETNPALGNGIIVIRRIKRKHMLRIIFTCQIGENCGTLKDGKILVIVVDNGGNATVGVDGGKPWLFLCIQANVDALECVLQSIFSLELLQNDGSFMTIGGSCKRRGLLAVVVFARHAEMSAVKVIPRQPTAHSGH